MTAFAADTLPALTFAGTIVAGVFALLQWRTDQAWKRKATTIERIKGFDETPGCRNAMMILKSASRPIPLWDPAEPPDRRYAEVSWVDAERALVPSSYAIVETPKSSAIRDCFEDFMNRLTQIEIYLSAGLLEREDARLLVEQWAKRLDGSTPDGGLTRNFRVYVTAEHKIGVIKLFSRFNVDITSSEVDQTELAEDLRERTSVQWR